ncbi:MAG: hypothetical protein WEB58_14945 [Planctomycetaceae bacterium]
MSRNILPFVSAIMITLTAYSLFRGPYYPLPNTPPDLAWTTKIFNQSRPLANIPHVIAKTRTRDGFAVTIKNAGDTTLVYTGTEEGGVQLFQELFKFGRWKAANWDWCGTGKKGMELKPGETVTLYGRFWRDADAPQRMLAKFIDRVTFDSGFVVLASEGERER